MLFDSITMLEGSTIQNMVISSGTSYPLLADMGEMFYNISNLSLKIFNGVSWDSVITTNNLGITIGTTPIVSGGNLVLAGLNSVSATSFTGTLIGNASSANNLSNGTAGAIPFQSGSSSTSMLSPGITGQVLTSNGTSAPTWETNGAVSSVSGTGTVAGITLSGTITTIGSLTLSGALSVTPSNFSSQLANTFLSAPNGAGGIPSFRSIVAADIPVLNQNTTGTASHADSLSIARTIGMTGDVTWTSTAFDGSSSVTGTSTLATVTDSGTGTFKKITVDTKGRVTGTSAVTSADITGLVAANTYQPYDADLTTWSNVTPAAGITTFLTTPTAANLAAVVTGGTGTGSLVFATSPTLVTPVLGVATGTSFNGITGLSSTTPSALGTAAIGTNTATARADHVHAMPYLGTTLLQATSAAQAVTGLTSVTATTFIGALTGHASSDLALAGGTMSGAINFGGFTGANIGSPSVGTDVANKNYVDAAIAGLSWKNSVDVATTANITLSATQTIDGVALVAGNRVLVKNQTTTSQNGIYVVGASAWARALDFDSISPLDEINSAAVYVEKGTVNADTGWTQTSIVTTVGTDPISFTQFSGSGAYTAGTGLSLTGNTFANTGVTSFNSRTGGVTLTSGDVTSALTFTPYNATNPSGYTTNLGTVTGVTATAPVVSSGGTAPVISMAAATASVNGYMTSAYASKLDGIAAGAQVNVATNLGLSTQTATSAVITSSTGTGVTISEASTSLAGLLNAADKVKLNATTNTNTGDETTATIKSKLGITTLSGSNTGDQTSVTGNAGTATKLATARTVTLSGDVTGSVSFDGSANVAITTTVANDSHTHGSSTISGTEASTVSTVVQRNASGDINVRLTRSEYANESTISGAMAFRINNSTDNYVRFCSDAAAIRTYLGAAPLSAPTFTGVPAAPTAAVGTNTTQLATTAFVNAEIANDAPSKTGTGASGTWGINVTGNAASSSRISFNDRRSVVQTPGYFGAGTDWSFMANTTDGLSDGGTYHGVMHYQTYTDATGGGAYELGFTDNNNLWMRGSSGALTSWAAWKKIWDTSNLTNLNQLTNGPGYITTSASITGNAATATKLATARTINGVAFDGTANITVADSTKAAIASPTFTGVPAAPTAAVGTNTTQLATTAFVNAEIANDAPSKTGTGASGLWGIDIAGAANNLVGPAATNGTDGWFRSSGATGWYSTDYAVGIYATETTNVRTYGTGTNFIAAGNVTAYSDERLKKDWAQLPQDYLVKLAQVKYGTYTRKDSEVRQVGISAQDLNSFLPEAVMGTGEGDDYFSVAYGNAALVSAVELAKEVIALNAVIAAQEERLQKLEALLVK